MNEKRTQDQRPVFMGTFSKEVKLIKDQLGFMKDDVKNTSKVSNVALEKIRDTERKIKINSLLAGAAIVIATLAAIIAVLS